MIDNAKDNLKLIESILISTGKYERSLIQQLVKAATPADNYGDLYQLTYNQQESSHEHIVSFMRKHKLTSKCRIMEIMSGNGFELNCVRKELPKNHYTASDIDLSYFEHIKGIHYEQIDCTDENFIGKPHDLIFIGGANASMCMLTKMGQIQNLAKFLWNNTTNKGYVCLSFFEGDSVTTSWDIDYSVNKVANFPKYKGKYVHWFSVTKYDGDTQLQHYHNLVIVSKHEKLHDGMDLETVLVGKGAFVARSWPVIIVKEIMEQHGFKFLHTDADTDVDTRAMFFKKCVEPLAKRKAVSKSSSVKRKKITT